MGSGAAAAGAGASGAGAGASGAGCAALAACLLAACAPTAAAVPATTVVRTAIRAIGRLLSMSVLLSRNGSDCWGKICEGGCDQLVGDTRSLEQHTVGPPHGVGEGRRPEVLPDQQRS